ncbi:MAG: sulfurtransferase TusA family protein [Actinomycetota bacterium]|nr:sulfurtransferase TusA family protein [Actinomycetota bacterium]
MRLAEPLRKLSPGQVVRLVATDPAAPLDIPAWCHLTGHGFLGCGTGSDGRAHYDIEVRENVRNTRHGRPWQVATSASSTEGPTL